MSKKTNEVVLLLEDFFTDYLPNVKGLSKNSITAYQYAFQLLFRYLLDEKGLRPDKVTFEALSRETIEDFLLYLEDERGCSIKTRNLRRAAIFSFARFASKKSFSAALPFYSGISQVPKKREPKKIGFKHFSKEEITTLLKMQDTSRLIGQRDVTLLSLLYASGARAQELCDIKLDDITLGSPTKVRLTGKGSKSRVVTIPDNCTAILKEYLRSRKLDLSSVVTKDRHLFSSQTREHMTIACVEGVVKKYVTKAKEENPHLFRENSYSPHSFRHSIAVHMLEAGDSLVAIKAFLGHSSIATTCIYATVTPELANKYLDERGKPLQDVASTNNPPPLSLAMPFLFRKQ
ncbi:MAG: site-specific integrase [Bacillaceae bacterium]|nr:site-specific integrase [Bacillaceae bacterium]